MTDKPKRDHWSELADKVGAETPPDEGRESEPSASSDDVQRDSVASAWPAGEVSGAANNAEPEQAEDDSSGKAAELLQKDAKPHKAPASRAKSGWDDLADQFDLPLPDKPVEVQAEPTAETVAVDDASLEGESPAQPPQGFCEDSRRTEAAGQDQMAVSSGAEQFDALFLDSPDAANLDATSAQDIVEPCFEKAITTVSDELSVERSAKDKKDGRRRKTRRRRPEREDMDKEIAGEDADGFGSGLLNSDKAAGGDEQENGDRKRGKRRRRRGSRRRKDSQQTVVEESLHEAEDAWDEEMAAESQSRVEPQDRDGAEYKDKKQQQRRRQKTTSGEENKTFSHRGIPTWDEAIEHVIAANLEKRSKKSAGSQSRSKGGKRRSGGERASSRKRSG